MANENTANSQQVKIKIANDMYLVCEVYNPYECEEEMTVYIECNGVITQDILLARKGPNLPGESPTVEALVWEDENNEDYTKKFTIPVNTDEGKCEGQ